jgi:hypothetical protein
MMKLLKAFGPQTSRANHEKFLKMWVAHFVKGSEFHDFQMSMLKFICAEGTTELKESLQVAPEEMAVVLDASKISLSKYDKLESHVRGILREKGLEHLSTLPMMHRVKKALRDSHKKIPDLFEFDKCNAVGGRKKQGASSSSAADSGGVLGSASCRLSAVVEWICYALTGLGNIGKAATWKLSTDGRQICKSTSQVVFSVQPVGLPLWHFSQNGTSGARTKDPSKNKQWAKDSSYLVFPFLIFQGKEKSETFRRAIPKHVLSDMIRLEHDGLHFSPLGEEGEYSRGFLPACDKKSLKWCGGVLYKMESQERIEMWRAGSKMMQKDGSSRSATATTTASTTTAAAMTKEVQVDCGIWEAVAGLKKDEDTQSGASPSQTVTDSGRKRRTVSQLRKGSSTTTRPTIPPPDTSLAGPPPLSTSIATDPVPLSPEEVIEEVHPKTEMLVEDALGVVMHYNYKFGWRLCKEEDIQKLTTSSTLPPQTSVSLSSSSLPPVASLPLPSSESTMATIPTSSTTLLPSPSSSLLPPRSFPSTTPNIAESSARVQPRQGNQPSKRIRGKRNAPTGALWNRMNPTPAEEHETQMKVPIFINQALATPDTITPDTATETQKQISKSTLDINDGGCLVHHCVFIMCGDLASIWALFGFCSNINGPFQCPCCTLARIDQWRGTPSDEIEVTDRSWQKGTPIPLAPSSRFVLCLLHCLLRIGDYALELLISDCLNEGQGNIPAHLRKVVTRKPSQHQVNSTSMADPEIAFLKKKDLKSRVSRSLAELKETWESYNTGSCISKATISVLRDVENQLEIKKVLQNDPAAKLYVESLEGESYADLKAKVREKRFTMPKGSKSAIALKKQLFAWWCQERKQQQCLTTTTSKEEEENVEDEVEEVEEEEENGESENLSTSESGAYTCSDLSMNSEDNASADLITMTEEAINFDEKYETQSLKDLALAFHRLRLPLKFIVKEKGELCVGRYSGVQMKKIFQNAAIIFPCNPIRKNSAILWTKFYGIFEKITKDPPEGKTRHEISSSFQEEMKNWKKEFLSEGGEVKRDWRIYLHLLECHAGQMYEVLGNLKPWSNEAGEQLHALDRMFYFQGRRMKASEMDVEILTTSLRVRESHYKMGAMQVPSQIPDDVKTAQPNLARMPKLFTI